MSGFHPDSPRDPEMLRELPCKIPAKVDSNAVTGFDIERDSTENRLPTAKLRLVHYGGAEGSRADVENANSCRATKTFVILGAVELKSNSVPVLRGDSPRLRTVRDLLRTSGYREGRRVAAFRLLLCPPRKRERRYRDRYGWYLKKPLHGLNVSPEQPPGTRPG